MEGIVRLLTRKLESAGLNCISTRDLDSKSFKMGVPKLSNCCGVSLKSGTIIIGVVQSIFAFMCMVLSAAYVQHPHELVQLNDASVLPSLESK